MKVLSKEFENEKIDWKKISRQVDIDIKNEVEKLCKDKEK